MCQIRMTACSFASGSPAREMCRPKWKKTFHLIEVKLLTCLHIDIAISVFVSARRTSVLFYFFFVFTKKFTFPHFCFVN